MSLSTTPALVPSSREHRRASAARAAVAAALTGSGCTVTTTEVTGSGCVVELYDARSLNLAVDLLASAARAGGHPDVAARADQTGADAWTVTAGPQTWLGTDGRPLPAVVPSKTAWRVTIPARDLRTVATCLLA